MSVFKSQFSRALPVYAGPNAVIPSPYAVTSGTSTSVASGKLLDNTKNFIAAGVKVGDVVYNTSTAQAATITNVTSGQIVLNDDIFLAIGDTYTIYQESSQSGLGNQGCYLYIDVSTNLTVVTLGGDEVVFNGLQGGTILPVQVIQVIQSTASSNLVALW
jgi:co-chaperonin GroES (HSP10)